MHGGVVERTTAASSGNKKSEGLPPSLSRRCIRSCNAVISKHDSRLRGGREVCLHQAHSDGIVDEGGGRIVIGECFPPIMLAFETAIAVHFPALFAATGHARMHRHTVFAAVALQECVMIANRNSDENHW